MRYLKIEFSKSREQWKELGPKFSSDEMGVILAYFCHIKSAISLSKDGVITA